MTEQQQQQQQQQASYCDLDCFKRYSNFESINEIELRYAVNYICGNLNADYTLNCRYWYDMYTYTSKNFIVLRHRKENGILNPLTKLGECVCQNKVINFLKNSDKKCFCNKGCASVYYKVVF